MKTIKKALLAIGLVASAVMLTSCIPTQPIQTVYKQPVPYGLSTAKVAHAIKVACALKGWHPKRVAPGVFVANMNKNAYYYVTVKIPYTNHNYSIRYVSSKNLLAQNGQIHRAYNKWVTLLSREIQAELSQEVKTRNHAKLNHV